MKKAQAVWRGVVFGDTVLVQGAGPVGQSAAIFAKLSGAGRVLMIGGPADRIDAATARGADAGLDIGSTPDPEERKRWVTSTFTTWVTP